MSQENVELSLLLLAAWNRRDAEAVVALWDPEAVYSGAFERLRRGAHLRIEAMPEYAKASKTWRASPNRTAPSSPRFTI